METIKKGLGFFAYVKTYGMLFIGILLVICALFSLFKIINSNYKKSKNSNVNYYNKTNSTECTQDEIKNDLCKLQLKYTVGENVYTYDAEPNLQVGKTTIFYKKRNPKSYIITPNPYLLPGVISCIACIILVTSIIRLSIIKSSKEGAAIIGGLDIISSVLNRLNKN